MEGNPSSSTVLRIPFEARPIHGDTDIGFLLAFHGGAHSRKKINKDEEEEEEKKSAQLSGRSSAEEALSNIHFASGTREACLKVSMKMHCATHVKELCEWGGKL